MDKYTALEEKLRNKATVFMANIMMLKNPLLLKAFEGADCILLDKEHGIYGNEELLPMTSQLRAMKMPSIVRVEEIQYHLIAKAIDMGADGIMIPKTETVEQVKTAVEAMNFPPKGTTGYGGCLLFRENESVQSFKRFLFVQIESHLGYENMDEMLARYGEYIDAFIVGPNDYSITMGHPLEHTHPEMMKEFSAFAQKCKRYNKSFGFYDPDIEHVKNDKSRGANICWVSDDFSLLKHSFEDFTEKAKKCLTEA